MDRGLIHHFEELELKVSASGSFVLTTSVTLNWHGTATLWFADTISSTLDFAYVDVYEENVAGTITSYWKHYIKNYNSDLPVTNSSAGASGSLNAALIFHDVKIYWTSGSGWIAEWSGIDYYQQGVLNTSYGSGSIAAAYLAPSGMPMIGLPPKLASNCGSSLEPVRGAHSSTPSQEQVSSSASGCWRIMDPIDSTYYNLPCTLSFETPPATPSPCTCDATVPSISVTDSYNMTCDSFYRYQTYASNPSEYENRSSYVCGLPDLTKTVNRLEGADYSQVWERFALPYADKYAETTCHENPIDTGSEPVATSFTRLNNTFLSWTRNVLQTTHSIESVLSEGTYCPYGFTSVYWENDDPEDFCGSTKGGRFPRMQTWTELTGYVTNYDHTTEEVAEYLNSHGTPLASFFVKWPKDSEPAEWQVNGSNQAPKPYWLPLREQSCRGTWSNMDAPSKTNKRTSVIAEPCYHGLLAGDIETYLAGYATSYVGVSRFDVLDYTIPASVQFDSGIGSEVVEENCSVSYGLSPATTFDVTLDGGFDECTVKFPLAQFNAAPCFLPQLAKEWVIEWAADADIDSIDVYLENVLGDRILLTSSSSATAVPVPTDDSKDSKYAGSWGYDWGVGVHTEQGDDELDSGVSVSAYGTDRAIAGQLFQQRTAAYLVYVIKTTSTGATVSGLEYPSFNTPTTDAKLINEGGHYASFVFADGPGNRFGSWEWYDGGAFQDPPINKDPGRDDPYHLTDVLDALCFKNVLLEGNLATAGLDAEIAAIYDSNEGQTREKASEHTTSFAFDHQAGGANAKAGRYFLINSLREWPPGAMLFVNERNATTYEKTAGSYSAEAYTHGKGPRDLVYPNNAIIGDVNLIDPSGPTVVTTVSAIVSGWSKSRWDEALDNDEGVTYEVQGDDGVHYASVAPYRGYFLVLSDFLAGGCLSLDVRRDYRHVRAYANDSKKLEVEVADNVDFSTWTTRTSSIDCDCAVAAWVSPGLGTLAAVYVADGDVYYVESTTEGKTWGVASTIYSGGDAKAVAFFITKDGRRCIYFVAGSSGSYDAKGTVRDGQGNVIKAVQDVKTGVDNAGIGAADGNQQGQVWQAELVTVESGNLVHRTSTDGVTFS